MIEFCVNKYKKLIENLLLFLKTVKKRIKEKSFLYKSEYFYI